MRPNKIRIVTPSAVAPSIRTGGNADPALNRPRDEASPQQFDRAPAARSQGLTPRALQQQAPASRAPTLQPPSLPAPTSRAPAAQAPDSHDSQTLAPAGRTRFM